MNFILERFCDCEEMGVFGRLLVSGQQLAYTVEQPWRDNKPFKSCVPAGRYEAKRYKSKKYRIDTFALYNPSLNVYVSDQGGDSRYSCLFHPANWAHQLQGCIALGKGLLAGLDEREDKYGWMVTRSRPAIDEFLEMLIQENEFTIDIIWKDHP